MILAAAALLIFHTVDGHEVAVAPHQITSVAGRRDGEKNKHFHESVHCVISLVDGKLITIAESCAVVLDKLEAAK